MEYPVDRDTLIRSGQCPDGHGKLLDIGDRMYCPHNDHDGRPTTDPRGWAPASTPFFDIRRQEPVR